MADEWVFLYDADCGMCTRFKEWVLRRDRSGRIRAVSLWDAEADRVIPEIPAEVRMRFAFLRAPDGRLYRGPDAILEVLGLLPGGKPLCWLRRVPGYGPVAGVVYNWIAARRRRLGCRRPG